MKQDDAGVVVVGVVVVYGEVKVKIHIIFFSIPVKVKK
jgi:hypothetical protein